MRNLNDGASALNVAEGAIASLSSIVMRLQELAEQSANGVFGKRQRESIDAEAQALSDEYFRIVKSTKFNGINLLDGSLQELRLQAGYGLDGGVASGIGGEIGTGSFGERAVYSADSYAAALGDLNGDGILDLVTAGTADSQGQASVRLGLGDGTFGERATYATETGTAGTRRSNAVALGDLNGDGILDLVTAGGADSQGQASVRLGLGDGTFGEKATYATETGTSDSRRSNALVLGDLNGDGILDLVTAGSADSQGQASVRLGLGDGTFREKTTYATETGTFGTCTSNTVTLGDMNGDGILDLVTAGGANSSGHVSVRQGLGDGTFGEKASYVTVTSGYSKSCVLGDVNGDEVLDLVEAGYYSGWGYASVLLGRGDGTLSEETVYVTEIGSSFSWSNAVALGDLNGDGILDMLTAGSLDSKGQANVRLGLGDGTFGDRTSYNGETSYCGAAVLGDVNGNGVLDLITAGGQGASVRLALTQDGTAPLLPFDLSTMAGARQALPVFSRKLNQLASQRGQIGAFQSRLGVAVSVLSASGENLAAASGRIMDADVAEESALLVKTEILQKAAAAVLSQANQQPVLAVRLLRSS